MSNVSTRWTLEATPITSSVFTALTALLTRILWVDFLDTNARFLSLVDDKLLKFIERSRVNTMPLTAVSDTFQVFELDDWIGELAGVLYNSV